MAKVTSTNLISEPRNNVVSLISDKTNVADPITTVSEYRKWIYSRDPDIKAVDFAGYPFIVINAASIDTSNGYSLDMTKRFVNWSIDIEVVTSDRGQGNNAGKGLVHNDAITDDILETFMDVGHRKELNVQGMSFGTPIISEILVEPLKHELTYRRIITVPFDGNWTQTSA